MNYEFVDAPPLTRTRSTAVPLPADIAEQLDKSLQTGDHVAVAVDTVEEAERLDRRIRKYAKENNFGIRSNFGPKHREVLPRSDGRVTWVGYTRKERHAGPYSRNAKVTA